MLQRNLPHFIAHFDSRGRAFCIKLEHMMPLKCKINIQKSQDHTRFSVFFSLYNAAQKC